MSYVGVDRPTNLRNARRSGPPGRPPYVHYPRLQVPFGPDRSRRHLFGYSASRSSTKSSTAMSGSWRLALRKAETLRPVSSSIAVTKSSCMLSCQI
jgi:hypothetical protein